jgi:hypothetical protein
MKIKKGGYAVKNGFYIKNDCKNNDEDGSLDEDGYILDPLTYEKISEGNLIQLSDGLCYNKSKNLSRVIKNRNTLPFGHAVTSVDKKKLSSSIPFSLKSSLSSIPSQPSSPEVSILSETSPSEHLIPTSLEEEEIEIIPAPRRRGRPLGSRNRTTRQRPILLIESGSPDSMDAQPENTPPTRRRGRPVGSRNRTTRQRPVLIIESDSAEEIGNSGRGTKKRNLKRKSKGKSKRKSKY